MNRLIDIKDISLEEATNLLKYLKYPEWVFHKENGVFYRKSYLPSLDILASYNYTFNSFTIYPMTFYYSQCQVDDPKKLQWEKETIKERVDKYFNSKIIRKCQECKTKISKCMGFVNARDFINYKPGKKVRELCGRCVLKYLFKKWRKH
jgi:hypothetical protein